MIELLRSRYQVRNRQPLSGGNSHAHSGAVEVYTAQARGGEIAMYLLQEWNHNFTLFVSLIECATRLDAESHVDAWKREFREYNGRTPEADKDWRVLEIVTGEFEREV